MSKIVLISGGTAGIGRSTVLELLGKGFRVSTFSRSPKDVARLKKELAHRFDAKDFLVLRGDVTKESDLKKIVAATAKRFGRLDVLINNAGIGYYSDVMHADMEKFRQMIEVNVIGLAALTKHSVPYMKRAGGLVLNIASIAGKRAIAQGEFYSSTKFAVMGFSDGLRKELRPYNIKVSTICPGIVATEFLPARERARRKKMGAPSGMKPESIARTIAHICSQPEDTDIQDVTIMPFQKGGKDLY
jgi:NADP-dependent 3-hydroxy acid dehydrogenase YdfG